MTLWDDTGQVIVKSRQTQPLRFGDRVDAIGYPSVMGVEQCLEGSLYRLASSTSNPVSTGRPDKSPLSLAERVRDLSREETTRRLPVNLHAIVTWGHLELPFAYVQDASGGIRVVNPKWEERDAWKPGTIAAVRGEVCEGDYVPVITNAVISRMSFWNLEPGRSVTLEQALTGVEDGHWVEMRGFVRDVTPTNSLVRLDLSTSSGEFQAWLPASQSLAYLRGSIIRLQGVCAAVSNPRHQLTGIELLAPDVKYLQVEEPAPDDQFSGPLRPLDSLRRFSLQNGLNQRVRTTGTVVLHAPGSYLYVQDGVDSVLALSQQREVLQPGERVEVVGFPGNEGRRFLLREAAYRSRTGDRQGTGSRGTGRGAEEPDARVPAGGHGRSGHRRPSQRRQCPERHAVNLKREFSDVPPIVSDRHKVLQILTNLFHNVKYACDANNTGDRKITVRLGRANANRIKIEVADNGVGIPQENLTRIFSFGFIARKNGHGFGLHSGALAAKEMGGCLSAQSEGAGKGTTFVLELPLNPRSDTKASA